MKPNQTKKRARIMIVDDHPAVREALASRIGRQPDLEVCAEAADTNEALRLLASAQPDVVVVDITLKTGSGARLHEQGPATDKIVDAIRRVLEGKVYLSEAMAEKMLQRAVHGGRKEATRSPLDVLADRELEVFRLIGQGVKTAEIAERLHLSVKTVETYRDRIRQKLDLGDGTELAHNATQWVLENG